MFTGRQTRVASLNDDKLRQHSNRSHATLNENEMDKYLNDNLNQEDENRMKDEDI